MRRVFAVVENNKVINVIVNPDLAEVEANPDRYVEYTNGWDHDNGIDGGVFFAKPELEIEE
jgi:hypothetical protein